MSGKGLCLGAVVDAFLVSRVWNAGCIQTILMVCYEGAQVGEDTHFPALYNISWPVSYTVYLIDPYA